MGNKNPSREQATRVDGRAPARTYTLRKYVLVNRVCKGCPLMIKGHSFLPFDEFDVILGMDWLVTHNVIVNCGKKFIELKNENGNLIRVESDKQDRSPVVITTLSTQRFLRKGYEAYLAFVLNTEETNLEMESVPIVCKYSDVFSEELPRLPPVREIEFGIELASGFAPISIAPYGMAPTELKELKAQLQELTDKGGHGIFQDRSEVQEVGFLGHIVSGDEIRVDQSKILAIVDWKLQRSLTELPQGVVDALSRKSLFALRAMNTQMTLLDDGSISAKLRARPLFSKRFMKLRKLIMAYKPKEFYWPSMKKDTSEFVSRCLICQQVKAEHQVPSGLLQPIRVPKWKWDRITMDFVTLTVDSKEEICDLYMSEIVRLHGVPLSIISDRDPRFTSRFWKKLQEALGMKLSFSTAFHPQTDGQSERVIQILEDMLRCCVLEFQGNWEKYLPLVEFAYNNSFQSSLKMAPYEALYGRKCRTPLYWSELREKQIHGVDLIRETEEKVKVIRECLKVASDRQKSYSDLKRKEIEFTVGDKVFLKVSPWRKVLRFGHKGKLSPRFIRPYEVTERIGPVAYRLALPPELEKIHDIFHISTLRRYCSDPSHVIVPTEVKLQPDFLW
ncbi:Retrotransposable element Tf2 [Gossypium australe]|uniref:Retrotransposable element Tf2 n=1 Tax=Gossypium australe TaxID=47621 RepID=A0A5B6VX54_9ROSI|nr:Retrotransposable element Tf2 [Gossypium australe]